MLLPRADNNNDRLRILYNAVGLHDGVNAVKFSNAFEEIIITRELLSHPVKDAPGQFRERYGNFILPTLKDPFEIWAHPGKDGSLRKRYIKLFQGEKNFLAVVKVNKDGNYLYTVFPINKLRTVDNRRSGLLLFSQLKK